MSSTVSDALEKCANNSQVIISENYIFIILSIIYFYIVYHSKYLIEVSEEKGCSGTIGKAGYDTFISGFSYWIMSFVLFIVIKYNGISTVNYFKIIGIGGSISIVSGEEEQVPNWLINFEFLWRLRYETRRRLIRLIKSFFYYIYGKFITRKINNLKLYIIE